MSQSLSGILLIVMFGLGWLRTTRNLATKRWLLPLTTAAMAALAGLLLSKLLGGSPMDYAVGIPFGMSAGLLLQHLLDYCSECGVTHPVRIAVADGGAGIVGRARCKDCRTH
jgi:hypothetical protein